MLVANCYYFLIFERCGDKEFYDCYCDVELFAELFDKGITVFSTGEHLRRFGCSGAANGGSYLCQRTLREKSHWNRPRRGGES